MKKTRIIIATTLVLAIAALLLVGCPSPPNKPRYQFTAFPLLVKNGSVDGGGPSGLNINDLKADPGEELNITFLLPAGSPDSSIDLVVKTSFAKLVPNGDTGNFDIVNDPGEPVGDFLETGTDRVVGTGTVTLHSGTQKTIDVKLRASNDEVWAGQNDALLVISGRALVGSGTNERVYQTAIVYTLDAP